MKAWSRLVLVVLLALVSGACQNTEQNAVQPEKLASSSPAHSNDAPPASGGPLVPFASGHGPTELAPPTSAAAASTSADSVDDFNPDGPAPNVVPKPAAPAPAVAKSVPGVTKLLKAGAAPRATLRFAPKAGDEAAVEMLMTTAIDMEVDGQKQATGNVPPIVFVMNTKVTQVEASGDIHYTLDVTEAGARALPGVDEKVITALNQALGSLVGLKGDVILTARGTTKQMKLSLPGKQNAATQQVLQGMEQAMQQLGVPLPEEDVGVGAKWTHTTTMVQNGISLTQVATYNLIEMSGNKITCKVALTQKAPKQKVASPVGVTVDLASLKSKGTGLMKLSLDQLTPLESKVKVDTKARMGLPQGQKMKMNSSLTVQMAKPKPRPKGAPNPSVPAPPTKGAPSPAPASPPAP